MTGGGDSCTYSVTVEDWKTWGGSLDGWTDFLDGANVEGERWECPHRAVAETDRGYRRCVFHLAPGDVPDGIDETRALKDAIGASASGDRTPRLRQFVGATFGPLDLGAVTVEIDDGHPIRFTGATFTDGLSLSGRVGLWADFRFAAFEEYANLSGTEFTAGASFTRAAFDGRADFRWTVFDDTAYFRWTEFGGETTFRDAELSRGNFYKAEFARDVEFRDAELGDGTEFRLADFAGRADFRRAGFGDEVDFRRVTFADGTVFIRTEFGGGTTFKWTRFRGDTDFKGARFEGRATFEYTDFGSGANFYDSAFLGRADFDHAEFNKPVSFSQPGMLPFAPFCGTVDFSNATFSSVQFKTQYTYSDGTYSRTAAFGTDCTFENARFDGGCDLSNLRTFGEADFSGAEMENVDLRGATLWGVNFENATLARAALYGTDLRYARLYGASLANARISDATDFGIKGRSSVLPFRGPTPEVVYDPRSERGYATDGDGVSNYTRAAAVYSEIESVADDNAASNLASTCYRWRKDMQRKRYLSGEGRGNERDLLSWGRSAVANAVVRYGESPYRVVGLAGLIILVCGLLYWAGDLLAAVGESAASSPSLLDAMYFSTLTFTTLGLGDFRPVNDVGRALAIGETSAGVILLALLVFVFGRRATR